MVPNVVNVSPIAMLNAPPPACVKGGPATTEVAPAQAPAQLHNRAHPNGFACHCQPSVKLLSIKG